MGSQPAEPLSNDEYIPTLTHATERDIDLMLVEELVSSRPFVSWIVRQCGNLEEIDAWTVLHSKRRTGNRREIDIYLEFTFGTDGRSGAVLIENKLDAMEQELQGESYREEVALLQSTTDFGACALVCPESYKQAKPEFSACFDTVITYESIRSKLSELMNDAEGEISRRLAFRCELIEQAIHKFRRGYEPVLNPLVGDFNEQYVQLLRQLAPDITPGPAMLKTANPDESVSMIFNAKSCFPLLPKEIRPGRFSHELGRGNDRRAHYVAVKFNGWGRYFEQHKDRLTADVSGDTLGLKFRAPKASKNRPNPGLILYAETPAVDNQQDFELQKPAITSGIKTADLMRKWLIRNVEILERWRLLLAED